MNLSTVVFRNLRKRLFGSSLTLLSLSAGITLFLTVDAVRRSAEDAFSRTAGQADLILAARGSALQTVLNALFYLETSTGVIPYSAYEATLTDPRAAQAYPVYVGDSYRGFRLHGTTPAFITDTVRGGSTRFTLADGRAFSGPLEAVAGADAAALLGLKPGDRITPEHGVTETGGEAVLHEDAAFVITGILEKTWSPADRVLYADLRGLAFAHHPGEAEAAHAGHDHEADSTGDSHSAAEDARPAELDAVLLVMKNPAAALQAAGNLNYPVPANPLLAMGMKRDPYFPYRAAVTGVIPATEMAKLAAITGRADQVLRVLSLVVVAVSLLGLMVAMYNTMNERTEELAVMRALGARRVQILGLILAESAALSASAALLSLGLMQAALAGIAPVLAREAGVLLQLPVSPGPLLLYLPVFLACGTAAGLIPALRAYRVDPVTTLAEA